MKTKLIIILLFFSLQIFSQEENNHKFTFFMGAGVAGNTHYGGFGYGSSVAYAYKYHNFSLFVSKGHHSNNLPNTQDRFLMYRSTSYGILYGPGYWGDFFSCSLKSGVSYINSLDYYHYNSKPGNAPNSNSYESIDRSYSGVSLPIQLELSIHGETVGFNLQCTSLLRTPHNDWRFLAGLTFGIQR